MQVRLLPSAHAPKARSPWSPVRSQIATVKRSRFAAEAIAEVLTFAPERTEAASANAHAGAPCRAALGIPEPSSQLDRALDVLDETVRPATGVGRLPTADNVLAALRAGPPGEDRLDSLALQALRSALEQRQSRKALWDDLLSYQSPTT